MRSNASGRYIVYTYTLSRYSIQYGEIGKIINHLYIVVKKKNSRYLQLYTHLYKYYINRENRI